MVTVIGCAIRAASFVVPYRPPSLLAAARGWSALIAFPSDVDGPRSSPLIRNHTVTRFLLD
jgi:hypothetical protein